MESSQVYGGAEECHSNESGWTMYIGSPTNDDDDHGEDNLNNNNVNGDSYDEEEKSGGDDDDDTDDSMASDASSGPSHWWVNGKIYSKNNKDSMVMRGNDGYIDKSCSSVPKYKACSKNSSSSSVKNKKKKNGRGEKEESVHSAKGAQKAAAKSHKEKRGFWKGKTGK